MHSIKIGAGDWGSIPIPTGDSKLPTDVLYTMGFDILPMLAEALDDETPTATVITQREGDFKQVKLWKVNDFAALLIVRIAGRDFVIGEFPKELGIRGNQLREWATQLTAAIAVPRAGELPEQELRRLRRENARLKQEVEFAKKAAAFFARESR